MGLKVIPQIIHDYSPEAHSSRTLLFNPPIYDTRFPWSRWQQPVTLLQLSTLLRRTGCDVRLVDAFSPDHLPPRRRMRFLTHEDVSLNWWRYGRSYQEIQTHLLHLQHEGWYPHDVYIEGCTTFWWEGVAEVVTLVRQMFPLTRVILIGTYPHFASHHATHHCDADIVVTGQLQGVAGLPLDLSHYIPSPTFSYLSIGTKTRPVDDLVEEVLTKARPIHSQERISHMAFVEHDVFLHFREHALEVLKACIAHKCKISWYALGNISPRALVDDPTLASLLFQSGFKQLVFADNRHLPFSQEAHEKLLEEYRIAIARCIAAGYPRRTESLVASVCLGRPGEDLEEVIRFMTQLAHIAGSLMVIPYQPNPSECPTTLPLEMQNGKLFPFAEKNHLSFREYQNVLGLAAIFNAKYRNRTFDFLGDGLISHLVQESLATESWNTHSAPGTHRQVTVGWFNKEGKWVRS